MSSLNELRDKAISDPASITDSDKLQILDWPSREDMNRNVSRATQGSLTPSQLLDKAATDPAALKMTEIRIIEDGFHYFADRADSSHRSMSRIRMSKEDFARAATARKAVLTPHEDLAIWNVQRARDRLVDGYRTSPKYLARMEFLSKPASWVREIQESQRPWGFAILKSGDTKTASSKEWGNFLFQVGDSVSGGLGFVKKGSEIAERRVEQWVELEPDENDVVQTFASLKEAGQFQPGILLNSFALVTKESMDLPPIPNFQDTKAWVWVYDADWRTSTSKSTNANTNASQSHIPSIDPASTYEGRLQVSWDSLFTWFYAERLRDTKTMKELWEESLKCPQEVWDTFAGNGIEPYPVPIPTTIQAVDQYDELRDRYD